MSFRTLNAMKKLLLPGLFAAALAVLIGFHTAEVSADAPPLWSVAVHIEYLNGDVYEHVLAGGLSTEEMQSMIADCGRSHSMGSAVRFLYCFPIPE